MGQLELLTHDEFEKLSRSYYEDKEHVQLVKVEEKCIEGGRLGYMGDYWRVVLTVRDADSVEKRLCFFVKRLPNVSLKEGMQMMFYVKETEFFSRAVVDMRAAQPDGGHDRWAPSCLLARNDLVIMEDLSVSNFVPFGARKTMDLGSGELILGELARFHAASILLEEKNRSSGETRSLKELYPEMLREMFTAAANEEREESFIHAGVRGLMKLMEYCPKYNQDPIRLQKLKNKLSKGIKILPEVIKPSQKFRNVICHADLWGNNIMIRYSEDEKPMEVRFVDFQHTRFAPPACDVMQILHLMTDKQFRKTNSEHLLDHYCKVFVNELRKSGHNPQMLGFPAELVESFKFCKLAGVITSAIILPMILLPSEIIDYYLTSSELFSAFVTKDRSAAMVQCFQNDAEYRLRISEVLEDYVELCDSLEENNIHDKYVTEMIYNALN